MVELKSIVKRIANGVIEVLCDSERIIKQTCAIIVLTAFVILFYMMYQYSVACTSFCDQYIQDVEILFGTSFVKNNIDKVKNIAEEEYRKQMLHHQKQQDREVTKVFYIDRKGFYQEIEVRFGKKFVKEHLTFLESFYTRRTMLVE